MAKTGGSSISSRKTFLWVAMTLAIFLFIDPFQWFSTPPGPTRATVSSRELEALEASYLSSAQPGLAAVQTVVQQNPVVLIGGHFLIQEHLRFVSRLIEVLPQTATRMVGVEFLLSEDQGDIDRLIEASVWDAVQAQRLVFRWQALCGYQENLEILKAVWQARQSAPAQPLRLIGLGVRQDLSVIQKQEDFDNPEIMKRVFAQGIPEAQMAQTALKTLADPAGGQRMVIFCQTPGLLLRWKDAVYEANMAKRGYPGQKRLGQWLAEGLSRPPATVALSGPWPYRLAPSGLGWPADGIPDQLWDRHQARLGNPPLAFTLTQGPLGEILCQRNDFTLPEAEVFPRLKDIADTLVVFGATRNLHTLTPIENFIHAGNFNEAVKTLPGLNDLSSLSAAQLNESIRRVAGEMQTQLAGFR